MQFDNGSFVFTHLAFYSWTCVVPCLAFAAFNAQLGGHPEHVGTLSSSGCIRNAVRFAHAWGYEYPENAS